MKLKMKLNLAIWPLVLLANFDCVPEAQSQYADNKLPLAVPSVTKFELTEAGNIAFHASLDDKYPVKLMFHTGEENISLTQEAVRRIADLKIDKRSKAKSWGGIHDTQWSENHALTIGNSRVEKLKLFVNELSGPKTDGKFGPSFFSEKILEFDFDSCTLTRRDTLPASIASYQRVDLKRIDGLLFMEGNVQVGEKEFENSFMIHTGFAGALLLDDSFVSRTQLLEHATIGRESELKDSFGNTLKVKHVVLPSLRLGTVSIPSIEVGLFDASLGRQKISVLGCNLLTRFQWILDLTQDHLYIKPNHRFESQAKPS